VGSQSSNQGSRYAFEGRELLKSHEQISLSLSASVITSRLRLSPTSSAQRPATSTTYYALFSYGHSGRHFSGSASDSFDFYECPKGEAQGVSTSQLDLELELDSSFLPFLPPRETKLILLLLCSHTQCMHEM